jgi:hypothetical protein
MEHRSCSGPLIAAFCLPALLTGCGSPGANDVAMVIRAAVLPDDWAYAYNQEASHALNQAYNADSNFARSSASGTTTVRRLSTGNYRVDLPGVGTTVGGNVQVAAVGSDANRCGVFSWNSSGSTLQVRVNCYTAGGSAADSKFVASYVRRSGEVTNDTDGAYLWANRTGNPEPAYSWNSQQGLNIVSRDAPGVYRVELPGVANVSDGTAAIQVTPYGGNHTCQVSDFFVDGSSEKIFVNCYSAAGLLEDGIFTLSFMAYPLTPGGGNQGGVAFGDQKKTASYNGNPCCSWAEKDGADQFISVHISRPSTGNYSVSYEDAGIAPHGVPLVTVVGPISGYCKIPSLWTGSTTVPLRCHSSGGTVTDLPWLQAFVTSFP